MGTNTDMLRRPLGAGIDPKRGAGGNVIPFDDARAFVACLGHARDIALKASEFPGMNKADQRSFLQSLLSLDDDLAAIVKNHTGHAYQY